MIEAAAEPGSGTSPCPDWFSADLHFGHARIAEYTGRPFDDVDEMDGWLIDAWNARVGPDDQVWVLGDVVLGAIDRTLPLVGLLAGHKTLVPGNHDRCWSGHGRKVGAWPERYVDAGFERIVEAPARLRMAGREVLVHHFPYADPDATDQRYVKDRPGDRGAWLLHGHVHQKWRQRGRQVNVGVDAWGGSPVSAVRLCELLRGAPADRPPVPWGAGSGA